MPGAHGRCQYGLVGVHPDLAVSDLDLGDYRTQVSLPGSTSAASSFSRINFENALQPGWSHNGASADLNRYLVDSRLGSLLLQRLDPLLRVVV